MHWSVPWFLSGRRVVRLEVVEQLRCRVHDASHQDDCHAQEELEVLFTIGDEVGGWNRQEHPRYVQVEHHCQEYEFVKFHASLSDRALGHGILTRTLPVRLAEALEALGVGRGLLVVDQPVEVSIVVGSGRVPRDVGQPEGALLVLELVADAVEAALAALLTHRDVAHLNRVAACVTQVAVQIGLENLIFPPEARWRVPPAVLAGAIVPADLVASPLGVAGLLLDALFDASNTHPGYSSLL